MTITECSSCGATLNKYETHCPTCGHETAYYHRQRRCLNCGSPVAQKAEYCLMCDKPVDSLILRRSMFTGSWTGVLVGIMVIMLIVFLVLQPNISSRSEAALALTTTATASPTATALNTPTIIPTPTDIPTSTTTPSPTPTPRPTLQTHVIASGEFPSIIADIYGVAVEELLAINGIDDETLLQVGQELVIPYIPGQPTRAPQEEIDLSNLPHTTYIIEEFDTLYGLALEYDTTVEYIALMNPGLDLEFLSIGQEIIIPLATPSPTFTPSATPTATNTPGPPYNSPFLLAPPHDKLVEDEILVFNWTAPAVLKADDFYVLQLTWADGTRTEAWVKNNSLRLTIDERPTNGLITWTVTIMRQQGSTVDGTPQGTSQTAPIEARTVIWK